METFLNFLDIFWIILGAACIIGKPVETLFFVIFLLRSEWLQVSFLYLFSLDLSLEDVYRKVWMPRHSEGEPMKVIYRLRGLLGDATEDMIESLNAGDAGSSEDAEQVYRMAEVLAERNGAGMKVRQLVVLYTV